MRGSSNAKPLRVSLFNAAVLAPRKDQLAWWLSSQAHYSKPVHVLLVTEPAVGNGSSQLHDDYVHVPCASSSDLATNPRLNTSIYYRFNDPDFALTSSKLPFPHLGIAAVEVLDESSTSPPLVILCVYLPNNNPNVNPKAFRDSLSSALYSNIEAFKMRGWDFLIGMDCNCPFKSPSATPLPPSINAPIIRNLLDDSPGGHNLQVLNWLPDAQGFFTFHRPGKASSQLDLFLAPQSLATRMTSLRIGSTPDLGSDHAMVHLTLSKNPRKPRRLHKTKSVVYDWSEGSAAIYHVALKETLPSLRINIKDYIDRFSEVSSRAPRDKRAVQTYVDNTTNALTTIILQAYGKAAPPTVKTFSPPSAPAPKAADNVTLVEQLLLDRANAAQRVQALSAQASQAPSASTELSHAKHAFDRANAAVVRHFTDEKLKSLQPTWKKLQEGFDKDKNSFHKLVKSLLTPPPKPLPTTLRKGNRLVTKPASIRNLWAKRHKLTPSSKLRQSDPQSEDPENKAFREQVKKKVKEYHSILAFDKGGPQALPHLNSVPTLRELKKILPKAKDNKAPGVDGILNEMIKRGGPELLSTLLLLFHLLFITELIPTKWKLVPLDPLFKRGDTLDPYNYRPIGKLSNLFKFYERWIDSKIRYHLAIPMEQCGFRPKYSTLTLLLRLKIILKFCASRNINLSLAFIDFKQAFERVWREGLLYRLWEAGIRGKMWRVVANQLSETAAYVRTNYGDTDPFATTMGVIQGSVLGPVLFLVFISPLAKDLETYSPSLNGITLRPQLFADDGLLLQLGTEERKALLIACLQWAAKWDLIVSLPKCFLFSTYPPTSPTIINGHVFKDVEGLTHLGVGMDRKGVFSFAKVRKDLIDLSNKHAQLIAAGATLGKLRADIGLFLFGSRALSLASHALPVSDPNSYRVSLLDNSQALFARRFLSLPDNFPGEIAKAELGLISYNLRATRAQLLLLVRTLQNPSDKLTQHLLTWSLNPRGKSMLDIADEHMAVLGITAPLQSLAAKPYPAVKIMTSHAVKSTQQSTWQEFLSNHTVCWSLLSLSKPIWE